MPRDVHERDCDCFGDFDGEGKRVYHSKDCRNCTCEKRKDNPVGSEVKPRTGDKEEK